MVVQWTGDKKYEGIEQAVPRRCIQGSRRNLVRGQQIGVQLGKKKSRVWRAIFLHDAEEKVEKRRGQQGAQDKMRSKAVVTKRAKAKPEGEVNVGHMHAEFLKRKFICSLVTRSARRLGNFITVGELMG